jgi:hypothetical protein
MTQAEVGAYILLLCAQWGLGEIPTDPERLAMIAKGPVSKHVADKFPNGKNPRMEEVRKRLNDFKEACSRAGRKGGGNPSFKEGQRNPYYKDKGRHKGRHKGKINSPSPSPSPSPTPNSEDPNPSAELTNEEAIYALYPRKQGKQDALKAIRASLKRKTHPELLEATAAFAEAVKAWPASDIQFIPHPATWFNRGSYDDDRSTWIRKPEEHGKRAAFA